MDHQLTDDVRSAINRSIERGIAVGKYLVAVVRHEQGQLHLERTTGNFPIESLTEAAGLLSEDMRREYLRLNAQAANLPEANHTDTGSHMKTKLILKNHLSPGDVLVMTSAIRELHRQYPGQFMVDVRTSCDAIFESSPDVEPLNEWEPDVRTLVMEYPLINQSDSRPVHFIEGYNRFLASQLDLPSLEPREFKPHIYLRPEEKEWISQVEEITLEPTRFWLINAGGKTDFTCKIWAPESFQAVVDHFRERIQFVQIGQDDHLHPALDGVIDLRGKTDTRQLIRLMYHASGVITGVSFPMHLAAAVECPPWLKGLRPCVVIAGGREPVAWEQYPGHQFLHTIGALECCARAACWKSRVVPLNDGSDGDKSLCSNPVEGVPLCMRMITPEDVIRAVEKYAASNPGIRPRKRHTLAKQPINGKPLDEAQPAIPEPRERVLLRFHHGLGDAVQLTSVLRHLRQDRPGWELHLETLVGKHTAYRGLADQVHVDGSGREAPPQFDRTFELDWGEWDRECGLYPATKVEKCLLEVFGIAPRSELARYSIEVSPERIAVADAYLGGICEKVGDRYRAVVLHYEGNTSTEQKNLSHDVALMICEQVRDAGYAPIILDWDFRSPLPKVSGIHCPDVHHPLWLGTGTGDAESIAALIQLSSAVIAIDSGPQKVAFATDTPTLAVWLGHHPLNYACPSENAVHLVPKNHWELLRGRNSEGEAFFKQNYKYLEYQRLPESILDWLHAQLGCAAGEEGLIPVGPIHIRRDNAEQDMVIVRDIYHQDAYRLSLQLETIRRARVIVDIGAHIGCFARKVHDINPEAEIICVEACPENIAALRKNVGHFAKIIQAACTYEPGELLLWNSVRPDCESTGGSIVFRKEESQKAGLPGYQYWEDVRPLAKVTLEELAAGTRIGTIDVLKLDCEGSEFSVLGGTSLLSEIGFIVGEYHGFEKWEELRRQQFSSWDYGDMLRTGDIGIFHLRNPARSEVRHAQSFLVLTGFDENYREIGELAAANRQRYAADNHYPLRIERDLFAKSKPARAKMQAIFQALDDFDWVFWTDADSLIMNPQIQLESFIDDSSSLIVASDPHWVINTGVMLIRGRDPVAKRAIRYSLDRAAEDDRPDIDQSALNELYHSDAEIRCGIHLLPSITFNSYHALGHFRDGDFLIHFPAEPNKLELMREYGRRLRPDATRESTY